MLNTGVWDNGAGLLWDTSGVSWFDTDARNWMSGGTYSAAAADPADDYGFLFSNGDDAIFRFEENENFYFATGDPLFDTPALAGSGVREQLVPTAGVFISPGGVTVSSLSFFQTANSPTATTRRFFGGGITGVTTYSGTAGSALWSATGKLILQRSGSSFGANNFNGTVDFTGIWGTNTFTGVALESGSLRVANVAQLGVASLANLTFGPNGTGGSAVVPELRLADDFHRVAGTGSAAANTLGGTLNIAADGVITQEDGARLLFEGNTAPFTFSNSAVASFSITPVDANTRLAYLASAASKPAAADIRTDPTTSVVFTGATLTGAAKYIDISTNARLALTNADFLNISTQQPLVTVSSTAGSTLGAGPVIAASVSPWMKAAYSFATGFEVTNGDFIGNHVTTGAANPTLISGVATGSHIVLHDTNFLSNTLAAPTSGTYSTLVAINSGTTLELVTSQAETMTFAGNTGGSSATTSDIYRTAGGNININVGLGGVLQMLDNFKYAIASSSTAATSSFSANIYGTWKVTGGISLGSGTGATDRPLLSINAGSIELIANAAGDRPEITGGAYSEIAFNSWGGAGFIVGKGATSTSVVTSDKTTWATTQVTAETVSIPTTTVMGYRLDEARTEHILTTAINSSTSQAGSFISSSVRPMLGVTVGTGFASSTNGYTNRTFLNLLSLGTRNTTTTTYWLSLYTASSGIAQTGVGITGSPQNGVLIRGERGTAGTVTAITSGYGASQIVDFGLGRVQLTQTDLYDANVPTNIRALSQFVTVGTFANKEIEFNPTFTVATSGTVGVSGHFTNRNGYLIGVTTTGIWRDASGGAPTTFLHGDRLHFVTGSSTDYILLNAGGVVASDIVFEPGQYTFADDGRKHISTVSSATANSAPGDVTWSNLGGDAFIVSKATGTTTLTDATGRVIINAGTASSYAVVDFTALSGRNDFQNGVELGAYSQLRVANHAQLGTGLKGLTFASSAAATPLINSQGVVTAGGTDAFAELILDTLAPSATHKLTAAATDVVKLGTNFVFDGTEYGHENERLLIGAGKGGVISTSGTVSFQNIAATGTVNGGAIGIAAAGKLSMERTDVTAGYWFLDNKATTGGAIHLADGTAAAPTELILSHGNFKRNAATGAGGAIYAGNYAQIELTGGGLFEGNTAYTGTASEKRNAVHLATGAALYVAPAAGMLIDFRDPISGANAAVVSKIGAGTWSLGGDSVLGLQTPAGGAGVFGDQNGFNVISGTLHLYGSTRAAAANTTAGNIYLGTTAGAGSLNNATSSFAAGNTTNTHLSVGGGNTIAAYNIGLGRDTSTTYGLTLDFDLLGAPVSSSPAASSYATLPSNWQSFADVDPEHLPTSITNLKGLLTVDANDNGANTGKVLLAHGASNYTTAANTALLVDLLNYGQNTGVYKLVAGEATDLIGAAVNSAGTTYNGFDDAVWNRLLTTAEIATLTAGADILAYKANYQPNLYVGFIGTETDLYLLFGVNAPVSSGEYFLWDGNSSVHGNHAVDGTGTTDGASTEMMKTFGSWHASGATVDGGGGDISNWLDLSDPTGTNHTWSGKTAVFGHSSITTTAGSGMSSTGGNVPERVTVYVNTRLLDASNTSGFTTGTDAGDAPIYVGEILFRPSGGAGRTYTLIGSDHDAGRNDALRGALAGFTSSVTGAAVAAGDLRVDVGSASPVAATDPNTTAVLVVPIADVSSTAGISAPSTTLIKSGYGLLRLLFDHRYSGDTVILDNGGEVRVEGSLGSLNATIEFPAAGGWLKATRYKYTGNIVIGANATLTLDQGWKTYTEDTGGGFYTTHDSRAYTYDDKIAAPANALATGTPNGFTPSAVAGVLAVRNYTAVQQFDAAQDIVGNPGSSTQPGATYALTGNYALTHHDLGSVTALHKITVTNNATLAIWTPQFNTTGDVVVDGTAAGGGKIFIGTTQDGVNKFYGQLNIGAGNTLNSAFSPTQTIAARYGFTAVTNYTNGMTFADGAPLVIKNGGAVYVNTAIGAWRDSVTGRSYYGTADATGNGYNGNGYTPNNASGDGWNYAAGASTTGSYPDYTQSAGGGTIATAINVANPAANGIAATNAIVVKDGGILSGQGVINANVNVAAGGFIIPGLAPTDIIASTDLTYFPSAGASADREGLLALPSNRTVTLSAGAALVITLNRTATGTNNSATGNYADLSTTVTRDVANGVNTRLAAGTFNAYGGAQLIIDIRGFTPAYNDVFWIGDFGAVSIATGATAYLDGAKVVSAGYEFTVRWNATTMNSDGTVSGAGDLYLTGATPISNIPEPSTYATAAALLLPALLLLRRRRRKDEG
ncbi:MAG: hypothetical protein LBR07_03505 [Puniceicoccales bacterium]|nr:hypothetical protein [Puniceicoccales bacterium]